MNINTPKITTGTCTGLLLKKRTVTKLPKYYKFKYEIFAKINYIEDFGKTGTEICKWKLKKIWDYENMSLI